MTDTSLITELLGKSRSLLERGECKEALPLLVQLIRMPGEHRARAMSNLAVALYNLELYRAAKVYVLRALELDPSLQAAHHNYANILVALKDVEGALHFYDAAYRLQPSIDSFFLYAEALLNLSQLTALNNVLAEHLDLNFSTAEQYNKLGNLYLAINNTKQATSLFLTALDKDSLHVDSLIDLSTSLFFNNQLFQALPHLLKAVNISPNESAGWTHLGILYLNMCSTDNAIRCFEKAFALNTNSFFAYLNYRLFYPKLPASKKELDYFIQRVTRWLDSISQNHSLVFNQFEPSYAHTFHFAYSNLNLKQLLINFSRAMRIAFANAGFELSNHNSNHRSIYPGKRIRIGFLSKFFNNHTNLLAFEGLIRNLDRSRFEVLLIHTSDSISDEERTKIGQFVNEVFVLSPLLLKAQKQLEELCLDILFFTDIGMNGFETYLANMRSAPIQLTGWGIPHTSGCTCIDYYVSSDLIERPDAEAHYSEKLIRLNTLPCCFLSENLSYEPLQKEYFFISDSHVSIGMLQGLHKIHPEDDEIFEVIAKNNPDSIFVFVESHNDFFTETFINRVKITAPTMYERMHLLKQMGTSEFLSLCECLDFLIDSMYYGSGITFYTASYVGIPIVTLEGSYLRNRFVAAGYRYLGITNAPIASTKQQFIDVINQMIENPDKRRSIKSNIRNKARSKLYNDYQYVNEFMEFAETVVKNR